LNEILYSLEKIALFWFRRDLRLTDNTGLHYAQQSGYPVLPIFIFDSYILDELTDKKDARVSFLYHQIQQLQQRLQTLGTSIIVKIGKPEEIIKELIASYEVAEIYTNRDYEQYAIDRDEQINAICIAHDISFYDFKDHVIFEKEEILNGSAAPYKVFTPYKNKWLEKLASSSIEAFNVSLDNSKWHKISEPIPSLQDIGFEQSEISSPANSYQEDIIATYDKTRDYPAVNGTSRLGVHLRFGTISIREAVRKAKNLNDTWLNELIWRDFYSMILANFPHVQEGAFKKQYNKIPWRNNEDEFQKWCVGKTGYPIVDAGMRELNETGHMHNRVRMIVASFLTKHLLIDWRWGEAYFAEKLLDYELASNNGGWQWAAGSGTDAQPYFRIFNPYSQTDKFDKDEKYIKRWVAEYGTSYYPKPIVEHKMARERALETYKSALKD
jgi:deoxyribodipyrimidine photo-lyase